MRAGGGGVGGLGGWEGGGWGGCETHTWLMLVVVLFQNSNEKKFWKK